MAQPQYTTIFVLLAGVFGGLGIVILLILLCKNCNKPMEEAEKTDTKDDEKDGEEFLKVSLLEKPAGPEHGGSLSPHHVPEKRLQRQKEIMVGTFDFGGQIAEYDGEIIRQPHSGQGWKGVITVERVDSCEHPENNDADVSDYQTWSSIDRGGLPEMWSRPPSRLNLHKGSSSYGSRRTLQSSLDSSICTDNRSEITVIEIPIGDRATACDANRRSASQDDYRTPVASPRLHLSAFRPCAPRRRQSSHTELNRPHEKLNRLIKSHDEALNYRLQKQSVVMGSMSREDSQTQTDPSNQFCRGQLVLPLPLPPVPSQRSSKPIPAARDGQSRQDLRNSAEFTMGQLGDADNRKLDYTSQNMRYLRSTMDGGDTSRRLSNHTAHKDDIVRRATIAAPSRRVECNVTYTSFDDSDVSHHNTSLEFDKQADDEPLNEDLLHPPEQTYAGRRQHFQRILHHRTGRRGHFDAVSSFEDSFDTTTTDGAHSSDTSRVEMTTTSFESTSTAFTDSSTDSCIKRQQMRERKDDSGYKSIEAAASAGRMPTKSHNSAEPHLTRPKTCNEDDFTLQYYSRTASSRRRDFHKRFTTANEFNIRESKSSFELETTDSNQFSSESFDDAALENPPKHTLFKRMMGYKKQGLRRDYTIDEKTDALFKEFTRYDPGMEVRGDNSMHNRSRSNPTIRMPHSPQDMWSISAMWKDKARASGGTCV